MRQLESASRRRINFAVIWLVAWSVGIITALTVAPFVGERIPNHEIIVWLSLSFGGFALGGALVILPVLTLARRVLDQRWHSVAFVVLAGALGLVPAYLVIWVFGGRGLHNFLLKEGVLLACQGIVSGAVFGFGYAVAH